jgi:carboxymethylenebutenolidase
VVLPNLYYRRTRDYWLKERTEESMKVMFEHMHATTLPMIVRDTEAMLKFVDAQPEAKAKKVAAIGYCMSGPFVMAAAAAFPDRIAYIASIHGANLVTDKPDSPHLLIPKIKCFSYFACAETDKWAPPSDIEAIEKALKDNKVPHRIEWYPKTEHGFVFPQRACYDKPAAERHWERLFDHFRRYVPQ